MADESQILSGSYKGVPISIASGSVDGGRKTSVKQFPNRDTQSVEDLGLQPRKYALEIILSDKPNQDYFSYRNSLLAAIELGGPGVLIHPLYGRVENVVATTYSLNEDFTRFGDSTVSVNFEVNENTGIPQSSGNVVTQISTANDAVQSAVNDDIAGNFGVTDRFVGNFGSAVDKLNGIIDRTIESSSFIGEAADTLNEFSSDIGSLSANVNSLVSQPNDLADSINGLFESVNGLYASAGATYETMIGYFGFGTDDDEIRQDTAGRIERKDNNDILNGATAASSLGYAYLSVTILDFETTQDIDTVVLELDDQFDLVQDSGSSQEVKDSITDMRIQVLDALEQIRINTSQIITIQTNPTSTRLLSFDYYGDDELGEELAELNGITDVSFIEGELEILTA